MDVSVIVVNYNTKQLTKECIDSVFKYTEGISFELILIDNASTDGSNVFFEHDDRISFVTSAMNLGFGGANNLGYKYAHGKYIFLLNSDTLLLNNAIKYFFDYAETYGLTNLGALGALLLNKQNEIIHSCGRFPTSLNSLFFIISSYTRRIGVDLHKWYFNEQKMRSSEGDVDYVTGADLFIPRFVIEQIGFFSPAFFMYFEETDLQKRMAEKGFCRKIIDGPRVIHLEGGSVEPKKECTLSKTIMFRRSEFTYLKTHGSPIAYVFYRFFLFLLSLLPVLCLKTSWKEKRNYFSLLLNM